MPKCVYLQTIMRVAHPGILWARHQLTLPIPILHELLPAGEEHLVPDVVIRGEGGGDLAERLPVLIPGRAQCTKKAHPSPCLKPKILTAGCLNFTKVR